MVAFLYGITIDKMMKVNYLAADELDWELSIRNKKYSGLKGDEKRKLLRAQLNLERRDPSLSSSYQPVHVEVGSELLHCKTRLGDLQTLFQTFVTKPRTSDLNRLNTKLEHVQRRLEYLFPFLGEDTKPGWNVLNEQCTDLLISLSEIGDSDAIHHNDVVAVLEQTEASGSNEGTNPPA